MNTILYHKAGGLSAPLLAKFMGIRAVRKLDEPVECLIRWGMATKVPTPGMEINSRTALVRYFSRLKQLQLLKDAGVSVPPFNTHSGPVGFPLLGRNEGHKRQSTRGRGITHYSEAPVRKHSFYTSFLPKQRQFRVHVIGKASRTRELIPNWELDEKGGLSPREDLRAQTVWNYHTGFTYRVLKTSRPEGVVPQAKLALEALQLDFGAVDIIVHDNTPYVLEVNTAPGLGPLTMSWYARHLAKLSGMDSTSLPGLNEEVVTNVESD